MICKNCGAPIPMGMTSCPYCEAEAKDVQKEDQQKAVFEEETCFACQVQVQEMSSDAETAFAASAQSDIYNRECEETVWVGAIEETAAYQTPQRECAVLDTSKTKMNGKSCKEKKQKKSSEKTEKHKKSKKDRIVNGGLLLLLAGIVLYLLLR